jgi:hypothetical protein
VFSFSGVVLKTIIVRKSNETWTSSGYQADYQVEIRIDPDFSDHETTVQFYVAHPSFDAENHTAEILVHLDVYGQLC